MLLHLQARAREAKQFAPMRYTVCQPGNRRQSGQDCEKGPEFGKSLHRRSPNGAFKAPKRMSRSWPSMRFRVKPHPGILSVFLRRRGQAARAIRLFADASLLPRPQHSFSPADLPSPAAGGGRRGRKNAHARGRHAPRLVCWQRPLCRLASSRPERYARTTVYPCDAGHGATTLYLVRSSVLDAQSRVDPSNERCPCRSPGGRTATRSDWPSLLHHHAKRDVYDLTPRPLASHDAAPLSSRSNASPFPRHPRALLPGPPNATARSTASAPTPQCPPCARACCLDRNAAHTIDSARCSAASATTARPAPPSTHARACCQPC